MYLNLKKYKSEYIDKVIPIYIKVHWITHCLLLTQMKSDYCKSYIMVEKHHLENNLYSLISLWDHKQIFKGISKIIFYTGL